MNTIPALSSPEADPAASANGIVATKDPQQAPNLSAAFSSIQYPESSRQADDADCNTGPAARKVYNQYACIRCRRLKKKCSKELPKCANCDRQGECCQYVERKNKRKPSISHNSVSVMRLKRVRGNEEGKLHDTNTDGSNAYASASSTDNETQNDIPSIALANSQSFADNVNHRRTTSNPTGTRTLLPNDPTLPSPKSSNIRTSSLIQLPPIRPKSTGISQSAGQNDLLPPLTSYSLQQHPSSLLNTSSVNGLPNNNPLGKPSMDSNILPSIPKQLLMSHPEYLPDSISTSATSASSTSTYASYLPSCQTQYITANGISSTRKLSISVSPTSSSQRDNTFLVPSKQLLKLEGFKYTKEDVKYTGLNSLVDVPHPNSLEQDLLLLIFNKIGFIDESIFTTFMNHNSNLNFERTLHACLKLLMFLDQKVMLKKLEDFKDTGFNWNEFKPKNNEDYFASIEFFLVYTCAILITNHHAGITNSSYHKSMFTMAYSLFQRKYFPITRVQFLRLMMLFEIISLLSDSDLNTAWFIQSNLSNFSLKWNLNKSLKKKNFSGFTLSELEYKNRLFWSIFVADSLISSTLGQQPKFSLIDIDVPLPIAITKDEEARIVVQLIVINMCKIQSRISSELYTVNAKSQANTDAERFAILSALRQDADKWYNECRISLSKLPQTRQENTRNDDIVNKTNITESSDVDLQSFAAWVSQEYYYILTQLFKSSNLFPKPDTPNFTVISNATYQNTVLLQDLILSKNVPNSPLILYRFANTCFSILICIYKGMFSLAECNELFENMTKIWRSGSDDLSKECYRCVSEIRSILPAVFAETEKKDEKLKLSENSAKLLLVSIKQFSDIMDQYGFSVSVDKEFLKFCDAKE